jgi:subtilisin family serine protease
VHRSSLLVRAALGACALAAVACTDRTTEPVSRVAAGPSQLSKAPAAPPSRYIVLASSRFGSDFAATVQRLGGTVQSVHQGAGLAIVTGLSSAAATQLAATSGIARVDSDAVVSLTAPVAAARRDASATAIGAASVANPTHAALYSWQWNMRDIHANDAWAAGQLGDPGVTVAILDTGIDYDALDLNGLVDLSRSVSFMPTDDAVRRAYFPGRNDISDFNGHGTNVATQVASKAVAFAGVTSRTKLIGVKVLGADGKGDFGAILNGILWAADHGADVANMSLGGAFLKAGNGLLTAELNRVFNYANQRGMLIVVAAGNDGADLDHDGNVTDAFCDMVHVVCVSATGPASAAALNAGQLDAPAFFTNFGRSAISVAGPGGNADAANDFPLTAWPWGADIASWVWSLCSKTFIAGADKHGVPVTPCAAGNFINGYIGTSQATPHVAGLAAMLFAANGHGNPSQIRALIEQSADDLGEPGTDAFYGRGRINVARAVLH